MTDTTNALYVDLDALLDSRMVILADIGVAPGELFGEDGWYFLRMDNDPSEITQGRITLEQYNQAWESRTADVLHRAMPTFFCRDLLRITGEINVAIKKMSPDLYPEVTVNTYPYVLNSLEKEELIEAVTMFCSVGTNVKLIHLPLDRLTHSLVKHRWSAMVMFNFHEWLEKSDEFWGKEGPMEVIVHGPNLAYKRKFELTGDMLNDQGPAKCLSVICSSSFSLNLQPTYYFSVPHVAELSELFGVGGNINSSGSSVSEPIRV